MKDLGTLAVLAASVSGLFAPDGQEWKTWPLWAFALLCELRRISDRRSVEIHVDGKHGNSESRAP